MKVSTEIDNNFGYEKITQLVDNIPLRYNLIKSYIEHHVMFGANELEITLSHNRIEVNR